METVTFSAPDIMCGGCANSIKNALNLVPGIKELSVDVEQKTVTVAFVPSDVSIEAIQETLTEIGFPATRL